MRVVRPIIIDGVVLTSSTIPEPDTGEVTWTAGTRLLGERFISIVTHRIYEVVADPSTTDDPVVGVNANPKTWVNVAPTNKFAMFDLVNSTQSKETTSLVVDIKTGIITNSIAGFSIDGAIAINIKMNDPVSAEVFDRDIDMNNNLEVGGWWDYFFAPIIRATSFVVLDMPTFPDATIKMTVTGDTIAFGNLVVGNQITLGISNFGTSLELLDFSRKEVDDFGNTVLTPGRTSKLVNFNVTIPFSRIGYVFNELSKLVGVPSVYVGTTATDDATLVFGPLKDFQDNISSPIITDATLIVEGLV